MEFKIKTVKKHEAIDITEKVNEIINKTKVKKGICNVFVMHTTMAVIVNDNKNSNMCVDFLDNLKRLFSKDAAYHYAKIDNNEEAHMKSAVV